MQLCIFYRFSQEDSFLKEREGSQPSEQVGDELASNKKR